MNRYKFINEKGEHLHTLDGRAMYGTSTVLGVLNKNGLTYWASGLACEKFGWTKIQDKIENIPQEIKDKAEAMGLTFKRGSTSGTVLIPSEIRSPIAKIRRAEISIKTDTEYLALLDEAYKAHATKLTDSADAGTDLHAELERFVKNTMANIVETYDDKIMPFITWANQNVKHFLASEINTYSEALWTGGIVDCVAELKNGDIVIIDFKSAKDAYVSMFMQIAGYDMQLSESGGYDKDGNKIFELPKPVSAYYVLPFGMKNPVPQARFDTQTMREGFISALTLHKILNV